MCSVLWALVLLLGCCLLEPALLGPAPHKRGGSQGWQDRLKGLKNYEIVVPRRVDRAGQPFPEEEHFLQKKHRTRRSVPTEDKYMFDDLNLQDNDDYHHDDEIVLSNDDVVLKDDPAHNRTRDNYDDNKFYTLEAFGEKFELELEPFSDFISPSLMVQYYGKSENWIIPEADLHRHCFHRGKVRGDPHSAVSLSVCHSLMGTILAHNHRYMIEPHLHQDEKERDTRAKPHLMYRTADTEHFSGNHSCSVDDNQSDTKTESYTSGASKRISPLRDTVENILHGKSRRKRSISHRRWVEVMVVTDRKMMDYHGNDLTDYVLTVMATVASIFRDPSIGNLINIVIVEIKVVDTDNPHNNLTVSQNAAATLRDFCTWQYENNLKDDSQPGHYDTAVLLTREDICRSARHCETLGLAETGNICDPRRSCSIVEDNGLSAAFTVAHEIGHVFNIPHDNVEKCKHLIRKDMEGKDLYHVMAPTLDYKTKPWSWSECSRKLLTAFLDHDNNGVCLLDKPQKKNDINLRLGQNWASSDEGYNVDQQCEYVFGKGHRVCPYMEVCSQLWCTANSTNGGCFTKQMPWADGTTCGYRKWCQRGVCVPTIKRSPRHGKWGRWGGFGNCSRTCGGGVKQKIRKCDNPTPSYGGSFCKGRRVKYRSCNTEDCPEDADDFRDQQCSRFNGDHFNIHGLTGNTKWIPKYASIAAGDRCKLFCRVVNKTAYYKLSEKVTDGTKCSPLTSDICVNGRCHLAGCDNKLGSTTARDRCGVCGGDGTRCEKIDNFYHGPVRYGYNKVADIPKGASHIEIKQLGAGVGEDENYLALRVTRGADNIYILNGLLNGNFVVSKFGKDVKVLGTVLQYSGSYGVMERINSTRPLKEAITLMVLSVGNLQDPNISYEYTVLKDTFYWDRKGPWLPCSCEGFRKRKIYCKNTKDQKVSHDEGYCRHLDKPEPTKSKCLMPTGVCKYEWRLTHRGKCDENCEAPAEYKCTASSNNRRSYTDVDEKFCQRFLSKPSEKKKCPNCKVQRRARIAVADSVDQQRIDSHIQARWFEKAWGKCSRSCGGGVQKRSALCLGINNKPVEIRHCQRIEQLLDRRPCNEELCPVWTAGEWNSCSVTCGTGYRHRSVFCKKGYTFVQKAECEPEEEPDSKAKCSTGLCPQWSSGNWGPCSSTCGSGAHHRAVKCRAANGSFLEDSDCNLGLRPPHKMTCTLPACTTTTAYKTVLTTLTTAPASPYTPAIPARRRPQWRTGSWTDCSVTCGTGTRERYVSCRDHDGNISDDSGCLLESKPQGTEECTLTPCGEWRIGSWTSCSRSCGQGVQTRLVACVLMDELEEQIASQKKCNIAIRPHNERHCNNSQECVPISKFPITSIDSNSVIGTAHWRAGPWGGCSTTCNQGWQRRKVVCQDENGSSNNCDPNTKPDDLKPCVQSPCPRWNYGNWGQCSKTCGGGQQRRVVLCQLPNGQTLADISCPARHKPANEQDCGREKCTEKPRWRKSPWTPLRHHRTYPYYNEFKSSNSVRVQDSSSSSDLHEFKSNSLLETRKSGCSASCGRGRKTRAVTCVDKDGKEVTDGNCNRRRPRTIKRCRQGRCPRWETLNWGKCSKTCGKGIKQRKIKCIRNKGRTIDVKYCEAQPRPAETEVCIAMECTPYYWQTGRWSQCSQTCGYGMEYRKVMCKQMSTGKVVDEGYCQKDEKPRSKKQCSQAPCKFVWQKGDFSQCSAECGNGLMTRDVTCHAVTPEGWVDNDVSQGCNVTDRPDTTLPCNNGYCDSHYRWLVTGWSECSKSCGYGKSRRKVQCIDERNKKHASRYCPEPYKPEHIKICYKGPCYASTCRELKHLSSIQRDGDYKLLLGGQHIPIYCHGMNTSHPKEYINMNSDEKDNYSEVFKKRLRRAATCPTAEVRSPSCPDCLRGRDYSRAGLTHFYKIRLNITSSHLSIISNDFTYSSSHGAKKIPFGSAGDCYSSSLKCPQGRFQINLKGTGVRVSRGQQWHSYGLQTSTKISISQDGQIVEGSCGGFCGGCKPPSLDGLQLTVLTP